MVIGRALRRRSATVATKGGYVVADRSALEVVLRVAAAPVARWVRRRSLPGGSGSGGAGYAAQAFDAAALTGALAASLRRLRRDHVDVYQLHGPPESLVDTLGDELRAWGQTMIDRGTIGRFGVGAETLSQAMPWIGQAPVTSVQIPYGILDPHADPVLERAAAHDCVVVARGVLGAGLLGGQVDDAGQSPAHRERVRAVRALATELGCSVADLALGFVRARPEVGVVVVGARSVDHLAGLRAAMAAPVDDGTLERLRAIAGVGA